MFVPRPGLRAGAGIFVCVCMAAAQPPLTTIHDVLYKADGTKFNGYAVINWNSFDASDTSNIATQFRAVRIVDGNITVKLVPTTNVDPPATYTVKYNSVGKVQFVETWAVPPSSRPLRVRDVRITSPTNLDSGTGLVQESDVIGLIADLTARPTQGAGYATGRVVVTNVNGELEAVSGNLADCVHVDGTSGPCGGAGSVSFVDAETPAGLVDGSNVTFTLSGTPSPSSSLALYRNGILQKTGLDFSISGNSLQFVSVATPQPGDTLLATYRVASAGQVTQPTSVVETLCSATGGTTISTTAAILGTCTIPGGTLKPGDRVEMRFDYAHAGTSSGFAVEVRWGATSAVSRTAGATESLLTGRAEAAADSTGA